MSLRLLTACETMLLGALLSVACGGRSDLTRGHPPIDAATETRDGGDVDAAQREDASTPTPQERWLCPDRAAEGELVPAMAVVVNGQLSLIHNDASSRVIHTFAVSPLEGTLGPGGDVVAQGGFLAAHASHRLFGGDFSQMDELVGFSVEGQHLWTQRFATSDLPPSHQRPVPLLLGVDGVFAVDILGEERALMWPDGRRQAIALGSPIAEPLAGGVVALLPDDGGAATWFDPVTETSLPLHAPRPRSAALLDGKLIYLAADEGGGGLFAETPTALERTPLQEGFLPDHPRAPAVLDRNDQGWVLVQHPNTSGLYNALTGTHVSVPAPLPVPDGFRVFGNLGIDHDGALLVPLRNASWAALFRFVVSSGEWQRVGQRITQVEDLRFAARSGSYAILTDGPERRFLVTQEWETPPPDQPADISGSTIQVLRPDTGVVFDWSSFAWMIEFSPDGRCAAYWDQTNAPTLTVLNLDTGETTPLHEATGTQAAGGFAWIPR